MNAHWLFHVMWLAIGVLVGAMTVACFSIVLAARGLRVAKKARHERDAMVKEVQRILSERREQCMQAYVNGVEMGLATRRDQTFEPIAPTWPEQYPDRQTTLRKLS